MKTISKLVLVILLINIVNSTIIAQSGYCYGNCHVSLHKQFKDIKINRISFSNFNCRYGKRTNLFIDRLNQGFISGDFAGALNNLLYDLHRQGYYTVNINYHAISNNSGIYIEGCRNSIQEKKIAQQRAIENQRRIQRQNELAHQRNLQNTNSNNRSNSTVSNNQQNSKNNRSQKKPGQYLAWNIDGAEPSCYDGEDWSLINSGGRPIYVWINISSDNGQWSSKYTIPPYSTKFIHCLKIGENLTFLKAEF